MTLINKERIDLFHNNKNTIIGGDMNSRTGTLKDYLPYRNNDEQDDEITNIYINSTYEFFDYHKINRDRSSQDKERPNNYGHKLIDFCINNNFIIINGRTKQDENIGKVTCKGTSVVDYILLKADTKLNIEDFEVKDFSVLISDVHSPVCISISNNEKGEYSTNMLNDNCNEYIVDRCILDGSFNNISIPGKWDDKKIDKYKTEIEKQNIDEIITSLNSIINDIKDKNQNYTTLKDDIENVTELLSNKLTEAAKLTNSQRYIKNTPNHKKDNSSGKNSETKEWFDEKCKESRKNYHNYKKEHNKKKTFKSYRDVQKASRSYKRAMNIALKAYKFEEQKKLKNLRQNDSKLFWKNIKKKAKIEKQPINELFNHFKKINENTGPVKNIALPHVPNFNDSMILNDKITKQEIMKAIKKLKNGKSPGIDHVTNEYIKNSVHIFLPVYEDLFNTILDTGIFPSQWSIGIISPIYKGKGSNEDPSNFRPISLLSCLGKVFTSILNSRLTAFLDENDVLNENQAGFREGYATIDHILTLHLLLDYMKFNKNTMFCCFMDLSKAYDKINRIKLFQKLELFDIKGKFFNVVLSMYSQTKSLLRCNGLYTNSFYCNIGIRQGENLSSMLFSIFLNDLESYLNENDCDYIFVKDHTHMHVFF